MWPNPQETAGLVLFTEKILMENLIFCAVEIVDSMCQITKFPYSYFSRMLQFYSRCLFPRIKNARIRVFTDLHSLAYGQNLSLYGRMPINENPYSRIFYAVMSILKCIATKNIKECSVYFESDNWKTWKNILKFLLNLKLNLSDDPRRLFHDRNIETSPLICRGLYHIETRQINGLVSIW